MPLVWCLADPKLGEQDVCLDLLAIAAETGLLAPGTTVLADKNLAGRQTATATSAVPTMGRVGLRQPQKGSSGWNATVRTPPRRLHPHRPALLAMTAAIWHNWATGAPESAVSRPTTTDHHQGIDHLGGRLSSVPDPAQASESRRPWAWARTSLGIVPWRQLRSCGQGQGCIRVES